MLLLFLVSTLFGVSPGQLATFHIANVLWYFLAIYSVVVSGVIVVVHDTYEVILMILMILIFPPFLFSGRAKLVSAHAQSSVEDQATPNSQSVI